MTIKDFFVGEWGHESLSTRRMLEALPDEHFGWKPHDKSMPLGKLGIHTADLAGWVLLILSKPEVDFAKFDRKEPELLNNASLLAHFDACNQEAMNALNNATDALFEEPWTLRVGEHVIFTLPKAHALSNMVFSHLYHHRAQLSVYLRLLNVPVPPTYGPTADDNMGF